MVFCENCGGLAHKHEYQSEAEMRQAFPDAHPLTDWAGRNAYVPTGHDVYVAVVPYKPADMRLGGHGWRHVLEHCPGKPTIYHRCHPHIATTSSPATVVIPGRQVRPDRREPVLAGHHG